MRVLIVLTYYRPHISGLTLYVQRLAEGLAARGHEVTVLTSQHEPDLPLDEGIGGVRVVRAPVAFRVGKGPVMPLFAARLWPLIRQSDVVSIHLPQLEGGLATFMARAGGRPAILTYHCDLQLPDSLFNRFVDQVVFAMNWVGGRLANRIVAYTQDFANHSQLLRQFADKIRVIPPPVPPLHVRPEERGALRRELGLDGEVVVGSATRVATEKGIEYLLDALPIVADRMPVRLLHVGESRNVLGEEEYLRRLEPLLAREAERALLLGQLPPDRMREFFSSIDVLVVSSVNSTESFGLVQVEAMLCGTPVVATNLPGVREPVRMTGMGEIVPPRNSAALADAIARVAENRDAYIRPRDEIAALFDLERTLDAYEQLFERST